MPLTDLEMLGLEKDGSKSEDYCKYCYANGQFVNPDQTMEEMVELCVPFMVEQGMDEASARESMGGVLPGLKRWKN